MKHKGCIHFDPFLHRNWFETFKLQCDEAVIIFLEIFWQTAVLHVITMSLSVDQYESLRQRVCPEEAIKPQLLGLQSLQNEPDASDTHQTSSDKCWQSSYILNRKTRKVHVLNHEDWRNETISEKLGVLAGICGKARAKVRQQFAREQ